MSVRLELSHRGPRIVIPLCGEDHVIDVERARRLHLELGKVLDGVDAAQAECYVVSETYPGYSLHLREIGDTPIHLGGHVKKPLSLCGRPLARDTRIPVDGFDDCPNCVSALQREKRTATP